MRAPPDTAKSPAPVEAISNVNRGSLYPWAVVAMLFPVALLNYLDRMMIATMRASMPTPGPAV